MFVSHLATGPVWGAQIIKLLLMRRHYSGKAPLAQGKRDRLTARQRIYYYTFYYEHELWG
jgi:hypothetical protein